jgi:hypothetical protein
LERRNKVKRRTFLASVLAFLSGGLLGKTADAGTVDLKLPEDEWEQCYSRVTGDVQWVDPRITITFLDGSTLAFSDRNKCEYVSDLAACPPGFMARSR